MPLNTTIAFSYAADLLVTTNMILVEFLAVVSQSDSFICKLLEVLFYYFMGFLKFFMISFEDSIALITEDCTLMNLSVAIWQKTAINATTLFGDYEAKKGLSYVIKKIWENTNIMNFTNSFVNLTREFLELIPKLGEAAPKVFVAHP